MKTTKPQRHHPFRDDPEMRDPVTGAQWCMCGMPLANSVHTLPDVPEQAEHRRRAGEK